MMKIKCKVLNDRAVIPTRGSEQAAGYDLYSVYDHEIVIEPHETVKIGTGLSFELPNGTFGAIVARSGLATKKGLRPSNCVGICDSDYRGEYIIALHNDTDEPQIIAPHERIAQLIIMNYNPVEFDVVDTLTDTSRGEGGFGSTGTN